MKPEAPPAPLTPLQSRAIDAILATGTREQAAAAIRVNVRTLRRWATLDAFASELRRRRTQVLDVTCSILATGSASAARALIAISEGGIKANPARVSAARAVLEHSQVFELNSTTDERITALEKWAREIRTTRGEVPQ